MLPVGYEGTQSNFNPRTPQGVRQDEIHFTFTVTIFQSTHPARGATHSKAPLTL